MVSPWKKTLPVIILTENLRFSFYVHGEKSLIDSTYHRVRRPRRLEYNKLFRISASNIERPLI